MSIRAVSGVTPGLLLCLVTSSLAVCLSWAVSLSAGTPPIDPFTCAIVLGIAIRTTVNLPEAFAPGIRYGSVRLLEIAVFLLGFSLDFSVVNGGNFLFIGAVLALVCVMLVVSFTICRAVGLPEHLAVLVACGNSICGNAAIAAVAPAVHARNEDVVAAVTFSSVLGVLFVVGLPFIAAPTGLSAFQFGTFAGLTVYAVPQVVAATAPVGLVSTQIGTAVKLVRVLMLVPAVLIAPLLMRNSDDPQKGEGKQRLGLVKVLPWFVPGFVAAAFFCNLGLVPAAASELTADVSRGLFVLAMAGLGLSVDLRKLMKVGPRLVISICLCLAALSLASFIFTRSIV